MAKYRLKRNYASKTLGPWLAGTIVQLAAEDAQRIENQAPGTLELLDAMRAIEAPPQDRMIKAAHKRGGGDL